MAVLCHHVEQVGIMGAHSVIEGVTDFFIELLQITSRVPGAGLKTSGKMILCSQIMMLSEFEIIGIWHGLGRTNEA